MPPVQPTTKPKTPKQTTLSPAAAFLKSKGLTAAEWKAKTQARWQKNNPQPLFPSTTVTPKEDSGLMSSARQEVTRSYAATPLPSQASYLQPFADANARTAAAGANYVDYLKSASANAQNLSGAFADAMTGGMNAGQQLVQSAGGSTGGIPPAAASIIPAASVGSSFTNYLNAEQPYVGAAVNEATTAQNKLALSAAADYQATAAQRRQDVQDAITKLYTSSLSSLQGQKNDSYKNAVTSYLALGKTAYQQQQLKEKSREFGVTSSQKDRSLAQTDTKIANQKAYQQSSLDLQRKKALKTSGVDTAAALRTLNAPTTTTGGAGKTGPAGQRGRWYTVTPITHLKSGSDITGTPVRRFVAYGEKVPVGGKDQKVTAGDFAYPKSTSGRKATGSSWDTAVKQLKAKYPGKITASWLKANFPPRPPGT